MLPQYYIIIPVCVMVLVCTNFGRANSSVVHM